MYHDVRHSHPTLIHLHPSRNCDRFSEAKTHTESFAAQTATAKTATMATIALALLMVLAGTPKAAQAQMSMLHTSGRSIVNANGQVVQLMGVNLGGWLVMEPWMTPADSGGLPDTYHHSGTRQSLWRSRGTEPDQDLPAKLDHVDRPGQHQECRI